MPKVTRAVTKEQFIRHCQFLTASPNVARRAMALLDVGRVDISAFFAGGLRQLGVLADSAAVQSLALGAGAVAFHASPRNLMHLVAVCYLFNSFLRSYLLLGFNAKCNTRV